MIRSTRRWALLGAFALAAAAPASGAAQGSEPDSYAGDLWSRPRLTGAWGGLRDRLAERGVTLDVDLLQILQGVGTGGRSTGAEYGGSAYYSLSVDTGKLGLWRGGSFNVSAMSGYGGDVNRMAGAIVPVNYNGALPEPDERVTALMNLAYTQMITSWLGVLVGKIDNVDGDSNEFADNYKTKFLNEGLATDFVNVMVPSSAWGGALMVLPWEGAIFYAGVLDPNGTPTDNGFDHAFDGGVLVSAQGRVTVKPFGLLGHHFASVTWSDLARPSLGQDPANLSRMLLALRFPRLRSPGPILSQIIDRFAPGLAAPPTPLRREETTWAVLYNFDQYLWSPERGSDRGVGVFFRFGVTDGNPNPFKYGYNAGVGGKGVVPGRPEDRFGIGWSRVDFSHDLLPTLRQPLGLGLSHEDAVEVYYSAAIAPWLSVTADLQIVEPGLRKDIDSAGRLRSVGTAVVGGLRIFARF
jgi:porin